MTCDTEFRYRRALNPEGLTTVENCLLAINDAVSDSKFAGANPYDDPAVLLLSRRLARLTEGTEDLPHTEDECLKARCIERLAALKDRPAIVSLVLKGVDHHSDGLVHYRREGQRTLKKLASRIGLRHGSFKIGYRQPAPYMGGDHILEGSGIYLRIAPERWGDTKGVSWRSPEWGLPGHVQRKDSVTVLRDLPAFARRVATDLGLPPAPQGQLI